MIGVTTSSLFLKKAIHERTQHALKSSPGCITWHESPPRDPTLHSVKLPHPPSRRSALIPNCCVPKSRRSLKRAFPFPKAESREGDRKSTRLNSSHPDITRIPSSSCKK